MSVSPTFNSRLRVLVAKAFRAEKLYTSIRNSSGEKLATPTNLFQVANDIRAKEWQRGHYKLRLALNDILAAGDSSQTASDITKLREDFLGKLKESFDAIEEGKEVLIETTERGEFAHNLRITVELIRHKARVHAHQVIVDELTAILESSGRKAESVSQSDLVGIDDLFDQPYESSEAATPSNVIPLKRRFAAGGRRGR